jgi:hypothetical protein
MGKGRYVWTSSDQNLGEHKSSKLILQRRRGQNGREGQTPIDGAGNTEARRHHIMEAGA